LVEDQVSVEEAPLATDAGFAASDTVGTGGGGGGGLPVAALSAVFTPPHAANPKTRRVTSSKVLVRSIAVLIP